jgi:hypothetical protein
MYKQQTTRTLKGDGSIANKFIIGKKGSSVPSGRAGKKYARRGASHAVHGIDHNTLSGAKRRVDSLDSCWFPTGSLE